MYLNILMTLVAVYVMLLPFLMFYFMTLIKSTEGNVTLEMPKPKSKADKEKELELLKAEKRKATLYANIDTFDGTSMGQIPIED